MDMRTRQVQGYVQAVRGERKGLGWRLKKNNRKGCELQIGPLIAPLVLHVSPHYLLLLCVLYVAPSFSLHCSSMRSALFMQLLCVACLCFSCCSFVMFLLHCSFVLFMLLIRTICITLSNFQKLMYFSIEFCYLKCQDIWRRLC